MQDNQTFFFISASYESVSNFQVKLYSMSQKHPHISFLVA